MCKFLDYDGKCQLWEDRDIMFEHIANSCDIEGHCLVCDDEDPLLSCEDYEER